MASSKQLTPKIPTDRLQGRRLGIVISGGCNAYPVFDLLSYLATKTEAEIHSWIDENTLQYLTPGCFQRFGNFSRFQTGSLQEMGASDSFRSVKAGLVLDFSQHNDLWASAGNLPEFIKDSYLYVAPNISDRNNRDLDFFEFAGNWEPVLEYIAARCTPENSWTGKRVLVTAGPTQENIDPIRLITNRSSGKMGFSLARQAAIYGAEVTLVSGPVVLDTPYGVNRINVRSADEMLLESTAYFTDADVVFAAAAVEDLKPIRVAENKLKKQPTMNIECEKSVDVLASLAVEKSNQFLVGFSVETEKIIQNSQEKLTRKSLDMIVANNPGEPGAGFQHETNKVTVLTRDGTTRSLPLMTKDDLALRLLDFSKNAMQANAR